jgi:hypothetical protein
MKLLQAKKKKKKKSVADIAQLYLGPRYVKFRPKIFFISNPVLAAKRKLTKINPKCLLLYSKPTLESNNQLSGKAE